jgi:putative lysine transport system permease protein
MAEMGNFAKLGSDIVKLWSNYGAVYLNGMWKTFSLAVICTLVGCLIGFLCGILQTIPCAKTDNIAKRGLLGVLRAVIRIYVEVFRGTPMILQAVFVYYGLPYFTGNAVHWSSVWLAAFTVVSINTGAYMAAVYVAIKHIFPDLPANAGVMRPITVQVPDRSLLAAEFPAPTGDKGGYPVKPLVSSFLLRWWEKKLDGSDSYDLATKDTLAYTSGLARFPAGKRKSDRYEGGR